MQRSLETGIPMLDWFKERSCISRFMVGAYIMVAALAGYSLGNGHTTQGAVQHVSEQLGQKQAEVHKLNTVIIPKLKAANHCEAARGDKAAAVATQAIKSAVLDAVPIPSPSAIPSDNCPHPAVK